MIQVDCDFFKSKIAESGIRSSPKFKCDPRHRNVHRLLLTCATVAEKYYNDIYYCNTYYANVGGISLGELNRLEAILLNTLMWQMGVSQEEYDEKKEALRHSLADALSASRTSRGGSWKEWIILKEGVCEKEREEVWEKQQPNSASSMQATTISGFTLTPSMI